MIVNNRVQQLGGAAFVLGNLLFITNKLDEMSRLFLGHWMPDVISGQDTLLILLGQVALIIGYVGIYQFYVQRVGRLGKNALRLFCGGGIVVAAGHAVFMADLRIPDGLFVLVFLGLALMLTGLILFGVVNLRQPVLGRWQWLPLVTGIMGFVGFFLFSGEEITATFLLFRTLFALGLIGLGLILWLEEPVPLAVAR
jgi:hypothetical protein